MPTRMEEDAYDTTINPADWEQCLECPNIAVPEPDPAVAVTARETDFLEDCVLVTNCPAVAEEITADCSGDGSGEAYSLLQDEEGMSIYSVDPFDAFTEPSQQEPVNFFCPETSECLDMTDASLDELGLDLETCFLDNDPVTGIEDANAGHLDTTPLHMFQATSQEQTPHDPCSLQSLPDHGANCSSTDRQNPNVLLSQLQPRDGRFAYPGFEQSDMAHAFQHDRFDWVHECDSSQHRQLANQLLLLPTDAGAFQGVNADLPQHIPACVCHHQFPSQVCSPPPPVLIQNFVSVGTINVSLDRRDQTPPH
ncbi:hypothetical protein VTG60DRAFT_6767 [Thermothelomyces hinnuleus]